MIYSVPIPILLLSIILNIVVHKEDSLHFHIMKNEKDKAMSMIAKIYPTLTNDIH